MLKGKVALVTGGTRGIGFSIVKKYLENGAKVVLCGSRLETAAKAVEKLKNENPDWEVEGSVINLTDLDEVKKEFKEVKDKYGSLDILVNNAGVSSATSLYNYTIEEFDKVINLNDKAVFVCSKAAAEIMKEQGGGVILNTSSVVSINGQGSGCAYPASKFGVNGLTISLARELGKDNIRVNAVAPGVTNTDMVKVLPKEMTERLVKSIPLGRIGEPEDVANAFLFLASDLATYISGTVLRVDGATVI